MAVAEGFMEVAAILAAGILVAVAKGGAAAVTAGVAVTGVAGTVIVGTGPAGMVEGMGVVGMVAVPTGGGVTPTRMLTDLTVGNSDKQKNPELQPRNSPG
ncbi:MAG: hypothetical protein WAK31_18185 [Chthoniobacterales bacterium]